MQAATRIQARSRSKNAKVMVKKLLASKASEKAAASATTSKLPLAKTPKTPKSHIEQMEIKMEAIFDIIRNKIKKKEMQEIPADGGRIDEMGKQVLYKTLLTYIMKNIGNSPKAEHEQARIFFGQRLDLTPDKEFTEQTLGVDTVTYIRFNINILCPESKQQLPTPPGSGQDYWDAHITLVNDAAMKNYVKKLSHLTFTKYNKYGDKTDNLHVFQDNADITLKPPWPPEISKSRLTTFRDLVFSFVKTHPDQLKEMDQRTYSIVYTIENDAECRRLGVLPLSSRPQCSGQQYKGQSVRNQTRSNRSNVNAGRRKFTLKISSHRTRYNKRKHKTINSTQKNKRRK